jgi:hypothetical protein
MSYQLTVAEWLFEVPVAWIVPQYATLSDYSTNEEGLMLPEGADAVSAHLNQEIFYTMTTAQAAQLFEDKGMRIAISDPTQAHEVYERIMKHLANWRAILFSPQLFSKEVPLEGLHQFNRLAEKLFRPANHHHYGIRGLNDPTAGLGTMYGYARASSRNSALFNGTIMVDINNRSKSKIYKGSGL